MVEKLCFKLKNSYFINSYIKLSIIVLNKIFILKAYHSMEKPSVLYKITYYDSEQNIYPEGL